MQRANYPAIDCCSSPTCFTRQFDLCDLFWPQGGSVEPHCPSSVSPMCGWHAAFRHSKWNDLYVWSSVWDLWSEIFDHCQGLRLPLGPHYVIWIHCWVPCELSICEAYFGLGIINHPIKEIFQNRMLPMYFFGLAITYFTFLSTISDN